MVTHLKVVFVYFHPVFQSSFEVVGDRRVCGQSRNCSLQGQIDGIWFLEQSACRTLAFCLGREAEVDEGGAWGFFLVLRA